MFRTSVKQLPLVSNVFKCTPTLFAKRPRSSIRTFVDRAAPPYQHETLKSLPEASIGSAAIDRRSASSSRNHEELVHEYIVTFLTEFALVNTSGGGSNQKVSAPLADLASSMPEEMVESSAMEHGLKTFLLAHKDRYLVSESHVGGSKRAFVSLGPSNTERTENDSVLSTRTETAPRVVGRRVKSSSVPQSSQPISDESAWAVSEPLPVQTKGINKSQVPVAPQVPKLTSIKPKGSYSPPTTARTTGSLPPENAKESWSDSIQQNILAFEKETNMADQSQEVRARSVYDQNTDIYSYLKTENYICDGGCGAAKIVRTSSGNFETIQQPSTHNNSRYRRLGHTIATYKQHLYKVVGSITMKNDGGAFISELTNRIPRELIGDARLTMLRSNGDLPRLLQDLAGIQSANTMLHNVVTVVAVEKDWLQSDMKSIEILSHETLYDFLDRNNLLTQPLGPTESVVASQLQNFSFYARLNPLLESYFTLDADAPGDGLPRVEEYHLYRLARFISQKSALSKVYVAATDGNIIKSHYSHGPDFMQILLSAPYLFQLEGDTLSPSRFARSSHQSRLPSGALSQSIFNSGVADISMEETISETTAATNTIDKTVLFSNRVRTVKYIIDDRYLPDEAFMTEPQILRALSQVEKSGEDLTEDIKLHGRSAKHDKQRSRIRLSRRRLQVAQIVKSGRVSSLFDPHVTSWQIYDRAADVLAKNSGFRKFKENPTDGDQDEATRLSPEISFHAAMSFGVIEDTSQLNIKCLHSAFGLFHLEAKSGTEVSIKLRNAFVHTAYQRTGDAPAVGNVKDEFSSISNGQAADEPPHDHLVKSVGNVSFVKRLAQSGASLTLDRTGGAKNVKQPTIQVTDSKARLKFIQQMGTQLAELVAVMVSSRNTSHISLAVLVARVNAQSHFVGARVNLGKDYLLPCDISPYEVVKNQHVYSKSLLQKLKSENLTVEGLIQRCPTLLSLSKDRKFVSLVGGVKPVERMLTIEH